MHHDEIRELENSAPMEEADNPEKRLIKRRKAQELLGVVDERYPNGARDEVLVWRMAGVPTWVKEDRADKDRRNNATPDMAAEARRESEPDMLHLPAATYDALREQIRKEQYEADCAAIDHWIAEVRASLGEDTDLLLSGLRAARKVLENAWDARGGERQ